MESMNDKPIPEFANEAEERTFWESPGNDSTEYCDWSKAKLISFPNLQPSTRKIFASINRISLR